MAGSSTDATDLPQQPEHVDPVARAAAVEVFKNQMYIFKYDIEEHAVKLGLLLFAANHHIDEADTLDDKTMADIMVELGSSVAKMTCKSVSE